MCKSSFDLSWTFVIREKLKFNKLLLGHHIIIWSNADVRVRVCVNCCHKGFTHTCVCVYERERERERLCVLCVWLCLCVCVCTSVCVRVSVCVWVRVWVYECVFWRRGLKKDVTGRRWAVKIKDGSIQFHNLTLTERQTVVSYRILNYFKKEFQKIKTTFFQKFH